MSHKQIYFSVLEAESEIRVPGWLGLGEIPLSGSNCWLLVLFSHGKKEAGELSGSLWGGHESLWWGLQPHKSPSQGPPPNTIIWGLGGGRISTYEFQEKYNHSVHNLTLKLEGINLHVSFLSKSGQYVKITNGICCQNALMLPMIDINYRNTLQIGGLSAPRGQLFLHPGSPQAQGYNWVSVFLLCVALVHTQRYLMKWHWSNSGQQERFCM